MSKENIQAFFQKTDQDPVLKEKAQAIFERSPDEIPAALAHLSTQGGVGFTAEEFVNSVQEESLSDAELEGVAGGMVWHHRGGKKDESGGPTFWDKIKGLFD